jgi:hypothetical protein
MEHHRLVPKRCLRRQLLSRAAEEIDPLQRAWRECTMLGWLTIFALLALGSLLAMLIGKEAMIPAVTAGALFSFLFTVCLITRAVRDRA